MDAPKVFWKYYDLYRRNIITLQEYAKLSGLSKAQISRFLEELYAKEKKMKTEREGDIMN